MSEQLEIPELAERIKVPVNHVWRVGDEVMLRLLIYDRVAHANVALPVFLSTEEARNLGERLMAPPTAAIPDSRTRDAA